MYVIIKLPVNSEGDSDVDLHLFIYEGAGSEINIKAFVFSFPGGLRICKY